MAEWQDVHSSSPVRTPKLQVTNEPSTGQRWIPPKKDTPHPRAKEKPQQDSRRRAVIHNIKSQTHYRCSEGANKTSCTPGPREWSSDLHKRLSQTCLSVFEWPLRRHESAVTCHGDGGSGCSRPGRRGMWHRFFWRRLPLAPVSLWAEDPQTKVQLYERSSRTVAKVLGLTADFPTWGLVKGLRKPREFDFEGQGDLTAELHGTGETDCWRAQTKPWTHQDPE